MIQTHTDNAARAKAKLLKHSLRAASRAGIDTTAFALLAVLIAESWPSGDGWSTDAPRKTLAQRLSVSVRTIDTARNRLKAAGLIDHTPGDPRRASSFTIRENWGSAATCTPEVKPAALQGRSQLHGRGEASDTPAVQPVAPSSGSTGIHQHQQQRGPGAGAGADVVAPFLPTFTPEQLERRAKIIGRRPPWLPTGQPWIDAFACAELAAAAFLYGDDLQHVLEQAERQRTALTNPAGWVRNKLREVIKQRASEQAERARRQQSHPP